jgi:protein CpxP
MKKVLLVCAFILGISAVSFAQDNASGQNGGKRRGGNPVQMTGRLKESLSLTDAQVTKVTAIYAAQAKVQDSLRQASNGDRKAIRPAMTALRRSTNDKITAVLTADQAEKFKKMLADQAAKQAAKQNGN